MISILKAPTTDAIFISRLGREQLHRTANPDKQLGMKMQAYFRITDFV